jgi:hypothetical protein
MIAYPNMKPITRKALWVEDYYVGPKPYCPPGPWEEPVANAAGMLFKVLGGSVLVVLCFAFMWAVLGAVTGPAAGAGSGSLGAFLLLFWLLGGFRR